MQFNDRTTVYSFHRGRSASMGLKHHPMFRTYQAFYDSQIKLADPKKQAMDCNHLQTELLWYEDKRPYYNVYPGIVPMMTGIKLTIPTETLDPPLRVLLVRLPTKNNPVSFQHDGETYYLNSVLYSLFQIQDTGHVQFEMWLDIGETGEDGRPVYTCRSFNLDEKNTVEEALSSLKVDPSISEGVPVPEGFMLQAVKLVCALCLLADDPEVIEPDVLAEDRTKYEQTSDEKYVEKARRRGRIGWNVGHHIEKVPHYRRPHMALLWTGKGRTVPRIGLRKGAIVKREVIGQMPTGYLDG